MKKRTLLLSTSALLVLTIVIFSVSGIFGSRKYMPRTEQRNEIKGAVEYLNMLRNNKITGTIELNDVLKVRKEIAELSHSKVSNLNWDELGPDNVGGRTRAILVDKDNSQLVFAGAVSGGLWYSNTGGTSWMSITTFPDVNVSCIAQCPITGNIYVGTGESFANVGNISGTPGFVGSGLYESTDRGLTWQIFHNAKPTVLNSSTAEWAFINRVAVQPITGRVYAATNKGLRFWDAAANEWINPLYLANGTHNQGVASTVVIATNGNIITSIGNKGYLSTSGDDSTFLKAISPATSLGRTEYAFAPSNPNYIYACAALTTGNFKGVYRSTDQGSTWTLIGPGGSANFDLFGEFRSGYGQGGYDNVIAVYPNNPDKILVGGINYWKWSLGSTFTQVTIDDSYDLHVDEHAIVFDPKNPGIIYFGTDGGIGKSSDGGNTFITINKNYNVTQFYSVAISGKGAVMSGTQDNSCPYLPIDSNLIQDKKSARVLYSGDGGWSAFSVINPDAGFGTSQYGGLWRSFDINSTSIVYQSAADCVFVSNRIITDAAAMPGTQNFGPFVTPMILWECFNDELSPDSTTFTAQIDYEAGDTVIVMSNNNKYEFNYILPVSIDSGKSIRVKDIISTRYFFYNSKGVWMTREALNFGKSKLNWNKISNISGGHTTIALSADGNYMYVGTETGKLYRLSNIRAAIDDLSAEITSPYCVIEQKLIKSFTTNQSIAGIAVDPNNPARVVVTLGNYGYADNIYFSENALDPTPTFTSKQGTGTGKKLPAMPVYCALIEMNNPNTVIIGTDYGIFYCDDITANAANITWTQENSGMQNVPVFQIRQQLLNVPGVVNPGVIYVGTHGRGFFKCTKYYSIQDNTKYQTINQKPVIKLYPNPVSSILNVNYTLFAQNNVKINIYDITGKIVRTIDYQNNPIGIFNKTINCSDLDRGTYILELVSGSSSTSSKFIVTK